ncbi:MAG: sigma-54 interaction domain-containing protein [Anaerovoracaceae bacterium]|jgi:transcriptional regulator with PAS, ATPase and Fis domain
MEHNFGLNRVLEPSGVFPAAAWKLDNDMQLRKGEARVRIERIHFEWDNFQQLTSSSGYEDEKLKARILDLIERRGKLQNPFSGSGGVLKGVVEQISEDFHSECDFQEGDEIYCVTSLVGIPIHIDEIFDIDYAYGQITCTGYAIIFETTMCIRCMPEAEPSYSMAVFDEAGSLLSAKKIAMLDHCSRTVIIGRNVHTAMMYAAAIREIDPEGCEICVIIDQYFNDYLPEEKVAKVLEPLADSTYFLNLAVPFEAKDEFYRKAGTTEPFDYAVIAEDIPGTASLGILLLKEGGSMYFATVASTYGTSTLCAESIDKIFKTYAFVQYLEKHIDYDIHIVTQYHKNFERIEELYKETGHFKRLSESRDKKSFQVQQVGKEDGFVYQSTVTSNMIREVMNVAKFDCNVIIQGETGVGKERVLSLIHQNSSRRAFPCVKINCATIQESLAESELFGYESGAFTGASNQGKKGYFELANNGILFLDEISSLSMNMQSKLLRVLQENQFYRVGGSRQISVNVRVICANNTPLKKLVQEGKFREDLYYRLNICTINVPPLRERREDILAIAENFIETLDKRYGLEKEFSPEALDILYDYDWPGNVRELENVVHRLVISSRENIISGVEVDDILNENEFGDKVSSIRKAVEPGTKVDFRSFMEDQEKQLIAYALEKEGSTRKAAAFLGLPQTTLARKKLKYGL